MRRFPTLRAVLLFAMSAAAISPAQNSGTSARPQVDARQFEAEVRFFLGKEVSAHVADVKSLAPPQERVHGALTVGEFSWGTFMRGVATYSELSGERTIAGKDVAKMLGKAGLIEAAGGGKAFSQMYAAMTLWHFGHDLQTNTLWQSLTPDEQKAWRSLLDPARFYDREHKKVINLPENYLGVASRIIAIDYQLGIITDRAYVDDLLDRAAAQFTSGEMYSDDGLPAGRYDRYSNEYARYVYDAAERVGRKDLMQKLEPTLKTQMRLWWDLLSAEGYGYPWGRSLGAISFMDTLEIVGFLGAHPQFRPAPLTELAAAYYSAWQWLENDFDPERHQLNVFVFGRGNYSYINREREWQQTTAFLGKASGAHIAFRRAMQQEGITSFPSTPELPQVTRFEYFRKAPNRQAGVWIVRTPEMRFALPITTGTRSGIADYLPAPYNLTGFAPPVEQLLPAMTPYIELADGSEIVASDGADEIVPSADGKSVRAIWRRWAKVGGKAGDVFETGLTSEVEWKLDSNSLVRSETITSKQPISIKNFRFAVPSTARDVATESQQGRRVDTLRAAGGSLRVTVDHATMPLQYSVSANGDSPLGRGSRGAIPLALHMQSKDVQVDVNTPLKWQVTFTLSHDAVGHEVK